MNPLVRQLLQNDTTLRRYALNKQLIDHIFFDTKALASGGLGVVGTPATQAFFDGATANNPTLTNILQQRQMEYKEVAVITGLSVTPLAVHQILEGANAAAVLANIARDVDLLIKQSSLRIRISTNDYPYWPVQSIGGDGGLQGIVGLSSTTAATVQVRSAPTNGAPEIGRYMKFSSPIIWYGDKTLTAELTGATGAFSAGFNVRVGIHATYFRNVRPEQPGE